MTHVETSMTHAESRMIHAESYITNLDEVNRVAFSIPETTDFMINSSGQATSDPVFLFTKQCKLVPAS